MKDTEFTLRAKDAPDLSGFDWADPFRLDDQLTEERMLRDSAQARKGKLQPVSSGISRRNRGSRYFPRDGGHGALGVDHPRGIWRDCDRICILRVNRARGGARGQRVSFHDVSAI